MSSLSSGAGLAISLLTSALVLAAVTPVDAEVVFFANGRTLAVKNHRIVGDTITVTLRNGGEATFDRALISHVTPSEVAEPEPAAITAGPSEVADVARPRPVAGRPFAALIDSIATKHGVDPGLVHAVVAAESSYQPRARSHAGARGLMQVMPATGRDLGIESATMLFDPQANLDAGVRYLKALLERFNGDLPSALAAYNAGPGAVARYQGMPPYPETRSYVRKVLANFHQ